MSKFSRRPLFGERKIVVPFLSFVPFLLIAVCFGLIVFGLSGTDASAAKAEAAQPRTEEQWVNYVREHTIDHAEMGERAVVRIKLKLRAVPLPALQAACITAGDFYSYQDHQVNYVEAGTGHQLDYTLVDVICDAS
jgi:hypothetical protein